MKPKRAIQGQLILQDLHRREEESFSDHSSSPEVLICEDNIVCVRKCGQPPIQPSPFYLGSLDENLYAV